MKRPPDFWERDGILRRALTPLGFVTRVVTATRLALPGFDPGIPVVCVGNASVGGTGKTIITRDILSRYLRRGSKPFALTRGHGGTLAGPILVDPGHHSAREVGDEALLLARTAPTIMARDRAAGARLASSAGASVIVMDDGLQNADLRKTISFLAIDGGVGFGNALLLPAGPLREPVVTAASRCGAAVLIGKDEFNARQCLPRDTTVLTARIVGTASQSLQGTRIVCFAGIGRPTKFFATLKELGAEIIEQLGYPDHYRYSPRDIADLTTRAKGQHAVLVTTEKDSVKLPSEFLEMCVVVTAHLAWDCNDALNQLLP